MPTEFPYDVFMSHNSKDKPRVRRLAERLKATGVRVWFDEWVIKPGDDIYLAIERGLEASHTLVLCLSPAALGSDWVGLERSTVLFRDPANAGRRFIPLLLADCKLPDTLRRYKHVDYREESDPAFEELLGGFRTNGAVTAPTFVAHTPPPLSDSTTPSTTLEYVHFRREFIERVLASFEPIHAFFFEICVDYMSLVEVLHMGVPASDSQREKYYAYVHEIGKKLHEIHILEGRLKVAGAEEAVQAMQQYRLQATEVNDMLRLQQPKLRKSGVQAVVNELFRQKDRFYEAMAKALKPEAAVQCSTSEAVATGIR